MGTLTTGSSFCLPASVHCHILLLYSVNEHHHNKAWKMLGKGMPTSFLANSLFTKKKKNAVSVKSKWFKSHFINILVENIFFPDQIHETKVGKVGRVPLLCCCPQVGSLQITGQIWPAETLDLASQYGALAAFGSRLWFKVLPMCHHRNRQQWQPGLITCLSSYL